MKQKGKQLTITAVGIEKTCHVTVKYWFSDFMKKSTPDLYIVFKYKIVV